MIWEHSLWLKFLCISTICLAYWTFEAFWRILNWFLIEKNFLMKLCNFHELLSLAKRSKMLREIQEFLAFFLNLNDSSRFRKLYDWSCLIGTFTRLLISEKFSEKILWTSLLKMLDNRHVLLFELEISLLQFSKRPLPFDVSNNRMNVFFYKRGYFSRFGGVLSSCFLTSSMNFLEIYLGMLESVKYTIIITL